MPGTPDRTTIRAAVDGLVTRLRSDLVAEPPTDAVPFRQVVVGMFGVDAFTRPFLLLALRTARVVSTVEDDKLIEVVARLSVVADVFDADPHATLLGAIGAVDDFFDAAGDTLLIEGAAGFDDRVWTIEYPQGSSGSRVAVASADMTFVVKVERSHNRVAAG